MVLQNLEGPEVSPALWCLVTLAELRYIPLRLIDSTRPVTAVTQNLRVVDMTGSVCNLDVYFSKHMLVPVHVLVLLV